MARIIARSTTPSLLTQADTTKAINAFARKQNYYASTVRTCSDLKRQALEAFKAKHPERLVTFAVYNVR
jgi:hypothetical protein